MLKHIKEYYPEEEFLIADGFDDAVIGTCEDFNQPIRLVYSVTRCIEILITEHNMSMEDAIEYFEFNVSGAYMGERTPVWNWDTFYS